ncbi:DUF86 domain-containing protein [Candidatus Woesearchaeota archaeon]|nr:DUF86 domain-containing protein [Candidatus Woesearchaeota archaeon]
MRIYDKLEEIEAYLSELEEIVPTSFEEYKTDIKTKAACERYFEKIIEAAVDIVFLIIKEKGCKIPEEDKEAFDVLSSEEFISKELAEKMKDAKGMRNILAHEYGKIDDEIVFHSITEEIIKDVNDLLNAIRKGSKSE